MLNHAKWFFFVLFFHVKHCIKKCKIMRKKDFFLCYLFLKAWLWCKLKQCLFFLMFCFLFSLTHKKKIKPYITHIYFLSLINTHTLKLLVYIQSQSNNNHKQYIKSPKIQNGPFGTLKFIKTSEAQTKKLLKLLEQWWRAGSTSCRHSSKNWCLVDLKCHYLLFLVWRAVLFPIICK